MLFGIGGMLAKLILPGFANAGADTSFQARGRHASDEYDFDEAALPDKMQRFAPRVWMVEGPTVHLFGFPYPTRMVAIRLIDGSAWIWSPIALSDDLAVQIEKFVGQVRYIVSPNNRSRGSFLKEWQERFPEAKIYASPGFTKREIVKDIKIHEILSEEQRPEFADEIDQLIFQAGMLDEVVFFHKPSKAVIFCDLIQRHFEDDQRGLPGWWMRVLGLVGPTGSTPKEWSFAFWIYGKLPDARKKLDVILEDWKPEGMIIAHGEVAPEAACVVIENALSWIPKEPKPCLCLPPM